MRRILGLTLTTLVTSALLLPGAAPAEAATRTVADEAGDAPRAFDITRLTVHNTERRLVVRIELGHFVRNRSSAYALVDEGGRNPRELFVIGWSQVDGDDAPEPGPVFHRFDEGSGTPVRCRGDRIRVSSRTDLIVASIPQRCLGRTAGRLRVTGLSEEPGGADADQTASLRVRRG